MVHGRVPPHPSARRAAERRSPRCPESATVPSVARTVGRSCSSRHTGSFAAETKAALRLPSHGGRWVALVAAFLVGCIGSRGEPGKQGPAGPSGPEGPRGPTGPAAPTSVQAAPDIDASLVGDVSGRVTDSASAPLEGVSVTAAPGAAATATDADGSFSFKDIPVGPYHVFISPCRLRRPNGHRERQPVAADTG